MWDTLTNTTGRFALGTLLLALTLVIGACSSTTTSYRSGSAYDPYYHDNRYRNGIYSHHRSYRSGYGARRYHGGRGRR